MSGIIQDTFSFIKSFVTKSDSLVEKKNQEKAEKVLFDNGEYRVPTQGDIILNKAIEDLVIAINNQDFFSAVKKLGIIELFKTPDIPLYTGMVYQINKDYEKIIENYSQVSETSQFFSTAMSGLATAYIHTGQYLQLDELLQKHYFEISPTVELYSRLDCLERMKIEDFIASYDQLCQLSSAPIEKYPQDTKEQEAIYRICRIFADVLTVAGECLNQCINYKKNIANSGFDFESYPETSLIVNSYKKYVYILNYSKYVQFIKFENGIESLATVALADKSWDEKIRVFQSSSFIPQIVQLIWELCRPERHPGTPVYKSLDNIMERYCHVYPIYIDAVIEAYFDTISATALDGVQSAKDYMALSYSRILVTGEDPYQIKNKLSEFFNNNPSLDIEEILGHTNLTYKMSRQGHDALLNAEYTFNTTTKKNYGTRDASGLALIFFRILEIEYNNKLIGPFAKELDFTRINKLTGFTKSISASSYSIDERFSKWGKDLESLFDLKTGKKSSLEIGVIRTLLAHIWHKTDKCASYLLGELEKHLTQKGKDALRTEYMIDIIGKTNVDMYRNPGAHTGFVPYSKACEAREFVKGVIPEIELWFIE